MKLQQLLFCSLMLIGANIRGGDNNQISIFDIVPSCQELLQYRPSNISLSVPKQPVSMNNPQNTLIGLIPDIVNEIILKVSVDKKQGVDLYSFMSLRNCNTYFRELTYDNPYLWKNIVRGAMQLKWQIDPSYTHQEFVLKKMEEAKEVNYRAIARILATIYNQNSVTELYRIVCTNVSEGSLFSFRRKKCFEFRKESKNSAKYISQIDKYPYFIQEYTGSLEIKDKYAELPSINGGLIARLLHKQGLTDDVYSLIKKGYNIEGLIETIMHQPDRPEMLELLDTTIKKQVLKSEQLPQLIHRIVITNKPHFLEWLLQQKDNQVDCFAKLAIMQNKPNPQSYSYLTKVVNWLGYTATVISPEEFLLYKLGAYQIISLLKANGADPHQKGGAANLNAFDVVAFMEDPNDLYKKYYNPNLAAETRSKLRS